MARGEHEAVAVDPVRVVGAVLHDPRVEHVGERRERHRRARMARVGLLDGVHRQRADGVDGELVGVHDRNLAAVTAGGLLILFMDDLQP